MYLNKAIILGNLTRDPELKNLPSGIAVCSFSLATNRTYKDKSGAKKDDVEYHNIIAFGKTAEIAAKYLSKGGSALVEGRLQTRSWDADGGKKYKTEIIAEQLQLGPRKEKDTEVEYPEDYPSPAKEGVNPDDVPF